MVYVRKINYDNLIRLITSVIDFLNISRSGSFSEAVVSGTFIQVFNNLSPGKNLGFFFKVLSFSFTGRFGNEVGNETLQVSITFTGSILQVSLST